MWKNKKDNTYTKCVAPTQVGFTLIELLVVIAIIVILAAICPTTDKRGSEKEGYNGRKNFKEEDKKIGLLF